MGGPYLASVEEVLSCERSAELNVCDVTSGLGVILVQPLQEHALELGLERFIVWGAATMGARGTLRVCQVRKPRVHSLHQQEHI